MHVSSKRFVSALASAVLAIGLLPSAAFAATPDADKVAADTGAALRVQDDSQRDWSKLPTVEELGSMRAEAVEVGSSHFAAIGEDGSLWTWGDNTYGQLGDGTRESSDKPLRVMENVAEVKIDGDITYALKKDGTLWSWGHNWGGLLGDGEPADSSDYEACRETPLQILDNVAHVPAVAQGLGSYNGAVALKKDGTLWYWGNDEDHVEYVPVEFMEDVSQAEAGYSKDGPNYVALKTDGSVWTWGHSGLNSLGRGDVADWEYFGEPAKVLDNARTVISGYRLTLAITNDSALWMWGQPGEEPNRYTSMPVRVRDGVVAAGSNNYYLSDSYMYAITDAGELVVWGDEQGYSFTGEEMVADYKPGEPRVLLSGAKQAHVAYYNYFDDRYGSNIALKSDGTLWTWGKNRSGVLGDAVTNVGGEGEREEPLQILGEIESFGIDTDFDTFNSVAALATDGSIWTWGRADGDSNVPRQVLLPDTRPASQSMHRLYNPYTGEHFYTSDESERDSVAAAGWDYEGVGWNAPKDGDPVYRLYNSYAGEHHYTPDAAERDSLLGAGWTDEGTGWLSGGSTPLYREYNPYMFSCNHNYTTDPDEHSFLVGLGWIDEGIAWYGV